MHCLASYGSSFRPILPYHQASLRLKTFQFPLFIRRASVTISAIFLIPPVSSSAKVFCAALTKNHCPCRKQHHSFSHETFPPYTICCHFHFQHYSPALHSFIIPILPYYALFCKDITLTNILHFTTRVTVDWFLLIWYTIYN